MIKHKKIILIILALIIFGVIVYFIYLPQIKASLQIWDQNIKKQEKISNLEVEKSNLNALKQQEKDAQNMADALIALVPEKKDTGNLIIELEALAAKTGVILNDIKFSQTVKTPSQSASTDDSSTGKTTNVKGVSDTSVKFKELICEMTVKGEYSQVISFLKGLETIKRATTLEKADLNEIQGIIQGSFKGKIYYKND